MASLAFVMMESIFSWCFSYNLGKENEKRNKEKRSVGKLMTWWRICWLEVVLQKGKKN